MSNGVNFHALVDSVCEQNPAKEPLRYVIEKEILHYDILFALSEQGLLDKLVFQGGTSLRLCYKSNRYSEDLDFAGGTQFNIHDLMKIKIVLENYVGKRYGLDVEVKDPKDSVATDEHSVQVKKWQLAITTHPGKRDLPKQKIKIEVANIPSYKNHLLPIHANYDFLPDGYQNTFLHVESQEEILADKVIAFVGRDYIKARDIWDIEWLSRQGIVPNIDFINKKILDYKMTFFRPTLEKRLSLLESAINGKPFYAELVRFLDNDTIARTLEKKGFLDYLTNHVKNLLEGVNDNLKLAEIEA